MARVVSFIRVAFAFLLSGGALSNHISPLDVARRRKKEACFREKEGEKEPRGASSQSASASGMFSKKSKGNDWKLKSPG